MAMERRFRKLEKTAIPGDKYVDPLYSRRAGFEPITPPMAPSTTMPTRTRGAGDPNYTKKMQAGKSKPVNKK